MHSTCDSPSYLVYSGLHRTLLSDALPETSSHSLGNSYTFILLRPVEKTSKTISSRSPAHKNSNVKAGNISPLSLSLTGESETRNKTLRSVGSFFDKLVPPGTPESVSSESEPKSRRSSGKVGEAKIAPTFAARDYPKEELQSIIKDLPQVRLN